MGALLQFQEHREREYRNNLFGDILEEYIDKDTRRVPEHLLPFTAPASRGQLADASGKLFLIWLAVRLGGRLHGGVAEDQAACSSDGDEWQAFFPEDADEEDAPSYEASALSLCDACPVKMLCLANDWYATKAEYERLTQDERRYGGIVFHGIIGGFRAYERLLINNRVNEQRLRYLSGAGFGRSNDRMSESECAAYERQARALISPQGFIDAERVG